MSPEIRDVLRDAARSPHDSPDVDDLRRRGRRRRTVEVASGVAAGLLAVTAISIGIVTLTASEPGPPIVGEVPATTGPSAPPETPSTSSTATAPAGEATAPDADGAADAANDDVISPAQLGLDVFATVLDDNGVNAHLEVTPVTGEPYDIPLGPVTSPDVKVVPDGRGGVTWQDARATASVPVFHVTHDGDVTTLADSGGDPTVDDVLVGGGEGAALITRRAGTTPEQATLELLEYRLDMAPITPTVIVSDVGGFEGGIVSAARLETIIYSASSEALNAVVVDQPGGTSTAVFESDASSDTEYAADVGMNSVGQGFALIAAIDDVGNPRARVLVIDSGEAEVGAEIDVPLGLGADGRTNRAESMSVEGARVLVNRRTLDTTQPPGEWLRPLVHDLTTGSWSVLDVAGPAAIARPWVPGAPPPPCSYDDLRREQAPSASVGLDLYLACEVDNVYRQDAGVSATGDVAADARTILELALDGPSSEQLARGYNGIDGDTGNPGAAPIAVRDVTFDGATLTVDFVFPSTGVGGYGTSTGSSIWHRILAADLLQFDAVDRVELRAGGTCAYGAYFEIGGCVTLDRTEVPWSND